MRLSLAAEDAIPRMSAIPCRSCLSCKTIVTPVIRGQARPAALISAISAPLRDGPGPVMWHGILLPHRAISLCPMACRNCLPVRSIRSWPGSIRECSTINHHSTIQNEADHFCALLSGGAPAVYCILPAVFHPVGFHRVLFQNGAGRCQG